MDWLPNLIGIAIAVITLIYATRVERQAPVPANVKRLTDMEGDIRTLRDRVAQLESLITRQEAEIRSLRSANDAISSALADATQRARNAEARNNTQRVTRSGKEEVVVAITADSGIDLDLPRLRQAALRNNFRLTRLYPATFTAMRDKVNRERATGEPMRFLHLAAHMNDTGVSLDRPVTVQELSEALAGIEIIVLNGCESTGIADYLSSISAVVSMREGIGNADAALFAYVFWEEVFRSNFNAQVAFESTLARIPTNVAEFVELHC